MVKAKKKKTEEPSPFGQRLAELRKKKGFTQEEFADKIGISRRALAYYETEAPKPPDGETLLSIAKSLKISVDQLLGVKKVQTATSPKEARLMNKLQRVANLPESDKKAVLRYIDALVKTAESAR